jgi:hypothetical protein
MWNYTISTIAFWRDEDWSIEVSDGMDDVALALVADAWTRTGHIRVDAVAAGPVKLRSGMTLVAHPAPDKPRVPRVATLTPMQQLEHTLCEIGERFGTGRREAVMMELEYAGPVECSENPNRRRS